MKAAYIDRHGTLDEIKIGNVDIPKYGFDEVLIVSQGLQKKVTVESLLDYEEVVC